MNLSRFKRSVALLLTLAFASAYLISPADGVSRVYASGSRTVTEDVNSYQSTELKITSQPGSVTANVGDTVKFTVVAQGNGTLKYQWYIKKYGASSWTAWNGHTTASTSAEANSTWNLMQVRCEVSDASGSKVYSSSATVTIDQPLAITTQPKSVTANVNDTVKFSVAAQGTGALKFQWYIKKNGASSWTAWNGHTTASTSAAANSTWNLMQVRCEVSDASGSKIFSDVATVTINQPLVITAQPKNVTGNAGGVIELSVAARGTGALKYQWYYKKYGASSWSAWSGKTAASISATANSTWNLMQVRCEVSDASGSKIFSDVATVTIDQPLIITTQPKDVTAKPDTSVKFSITAQGTGALKYQWYYKKYGASSWSAWSGKTAASISATANSTWNLMQVRCEVSDASGSKVTTNIATVTINQPLAITVQPKDVTVKLNDDLKMSVTAQGTGALKYQWYYKKLGVTSWSVWKSQTNSSIAAATNSTWNLMQVRCEITDAAGSKVTTNIATVTIDQPVSIQSQPKSITAKEGDSITFSVTAQGTGSLKYQWYYRFDGKTEWSLWSGRTSATITETAKSNWNLLRIRCKITDAMGKTANSAAAILSIDRPLKITAQPKDAEAKAGSAVSFSVTAQGTGALKYQWYYRKIGASSPSAWKGRTSSSFSAAAESSWDGMKVFCRITDSAGKQLDSATVTVIVPDKLRIAIQPEDITVLSGSTATFGLKAYCANTISYQWYYKKAGKTSWTLWSGKTTPQISSTADCTWHGMQVYCKLTDSKGNTLKSNVVYALITKQGSKRYFTRYITAKANYTKVYDDVGTKSNVVGKIMTQNTYTALEWTSDAYDTTWYGFKYNNDLVWVPRTGVNVRNEYVSIPDRKFNDGGIPIIYISPSKQTDNAYAYGNTTEQEQMYRVGNALKKILDEEYYCQTYIPTVSLPLGLHSRAYDAYIRESDVYLALHSNAVSTKAVYGAIGYYAPSCNQSKVLSQNIVSEMNKICIKKPNVTNQLREAMSAYDNTGYGEVRDPTYYGMVGVLAEVEYHDNKDSAKWIINNTDKIARALANALEKTFELQKKQ